MIFEDLNGSVFAAFCTEFYKFNNESHLNKPLTFVWKRFIKSKDIGIRFSDRGKGRYEVVDERKWLLSKIKYGI